MSVIVSSPVLKAVELSALPGALSMAAALAAGLAILSGLHAVSFFTACMNPPELSTTL